MKILMLVAAHSLGISTTAGAAGTGKGAGSGSFPLHERDARLSWHWDDEPAGIQERDQFSQQTRVQNQIKKNVQAKAALTKGADEPNDLGW